MDQPTYLIFIPIFIFLDSVVILEISLNLLVCSAILTETYVTSQI